MELTWYGWASFGLRSETGKLVVTDPYDPVTSGFKPFPDEAHVVVMSSDDDDFHCNAHLVPQTSDAEIINALEVANSGCPRISHGLEFRAIRAMEHVHHDRHDPEQNGMYRFNIDGIEFGHMGDVGNPFSQAQIDFFAGIDVLFALAGGFPVIDLAEVKRIVDIVKPRYVIPMHFRTLCFKPRASLWITEFLNYFPEDTVDFTFTSKIKLALSALPAETRGLIMDYI